MDIILPNSHHYPYRIDFLRDRYDELDSMINWCLENIGEGGYFPDSNSVWGLTVMFGNSFFQFKHQHDVSLFALKWT